MADDATPPSGVWLRRRARKYVGRLLRYMRDGFRYATFPLRYSDSRGVFDSFEQAKAAAPRGKPIGYDDSELANEYADSLDLRLADYDYPFLFHLDKMLNDVGRRCSILDFGGNVGLHYLKYRQHLDLENVTWTVCEVPAIAQRGRDVCKDHPNVRFINDVSQAGPVDIVLAVGSVQYVDDFAGMLAAFGQRPRCVLIGQVLLHDGKRFVTLQNGGKVYYPQHVFDRADFIASFECAGYGLKDLWKDTSNGCVIPFHHALRIVSSGLCFDRGPPIVN